MELRSGSVVGSGVLRQELRPAFAEASALLFRRWTALNLAVENGWGGHDSAEKAQWLLSETVGWFYSKKEHYVDELEEELEDALLNDFNTQLEDGSPQELAKHLVAIYQQILQGNLSGLEQLRATTPAEAAAGATTKSRKQVMDRDGTVMADSGDDSSSSGSGSDDDAMDEDGGSSRRAGPSAEPAARSRPPPVVDEDGFTQVPARRRGR